MDNEYRKELLASALEARVKEVTEYQLNVDNYRLAIARIGNDPDLQEFKDRLQHLLQSSVLEQKKAQLMLDVIKSQVE
jgi:hypothetical protein